MLTTLICLLPPSRFKNLLLRKLGHSVHPSARLGPVLLIGVGQIAMAAHASVGPFNVFRDLSGLRIGEHSVIGQWNWVSAARPLVAAGGSGVLTLGNHTALTSRHYLDASGGISIGNYSTVAGVRSTLITHGIDWRRSEQTTKPIAIGDYCLVSSNTAIAPGTRLADRSVTGMGATLAGNLDEPGALYLADRARPVKSGLKGTYFERALGFVSPRGQGSAE